MTQKFREGGLGWGTHINPWLIHVNVWQKTLQYCKVISLQLIKINGKKKFFFFKCRQYLVGELHRGSMTAAGRFLLCLGFLFFFLHWVFVESCRIFHFGAWTLALLRGLSSCSLKA